MTGDRELEELAAFLAHAIVRHVEVWKRNGQAPPALAVPLAGWLVAARHGTERKPLDRRAGSGDGGGMAPETPLLLTTRQVARLLQVSERTVRTMLADGRLQAVKLGTATRIPRGEVEKLALPSCSASPRFIDHVDVKGDSAA